MSRNRNHTLSRAFFAWPFWTISLTVRFTIAVYREAAKAILALTRRNA